jgi:AcrR family transcriptional regulator
MKPKLRRDQILRAAISVFAAKGYNRASVSDIIEAADVARGTFYLYFEGKREIFAELVDVLTVRLIGCMKRVDLDPGAPPWLEQIRANLIRISTVLIEERELTQILYEHGMGLDDDLDQKIRQFYLALNRQTEGALRLGQEMGLVRRGLDPALAAWYVTGAIKEVMYHLALAPEAGAAERAIDELIAYSTQGLVDPKPQAPRKPRPKKT